MSARKASASPGSAAGAAPHSAPRAAASDPLAVVELGTTSVRMLVAQREPDGSVRTLDSLQKSVTLGKDTFTQGDISRETTEACVDALRAFSRMLEEYAIRDPARIRAIATSAVREATNRDAFVDRLYVATGLSVDVLDEAEVRRLTYRASESLLRAHPPPAGQSDLVVEVGGGNTDILLIRRGRVEMSFTVRMGSLRLRELLEDYRAPAEHLRAIMEKHVERAVTIVRRTVERGRSLRLVALGGDTRWAASQIPGTNPKNGLTLVDAAGLEALTEDVLRRSVDAIVRRYHLSFPDAEPLGPALLMYVRIAQAFRSRHLMVGAASLRDGVLQEMMTGEQRTPELQEQILTSAVALGHRYDFDATHALRVSQVCGQIFDALQAQHRLGGTEKLLLHCAAILHEIGLFVSNRSHHKHSMYLVMNSDIFGLGARDLLLIALVARYHRKALPLPAHPFYAALDRDRRVAVAKLAAILRVADAVSQRQGEWKRGPSVRLDRGQLLIRFAGRGDLTMERHALKRKGEMFEQVYGMDIALRAGGEDGGHA